MNFEDRIVMAMSCSQGADQEDVVALLVRDHATVVYRVAFSVLHNSHDAEDVVQETFIRVMRRTRQLPLIRDQRAWLARIAWRLAITRWNRTRKRRRVEINMSEDTPDLALSNVAIEVNHQNKELLETINRLTSSLPDKLRHPLVLSAIDEMSSREVAAILDISETTVRTRVHRARRFLLAKLRRRTDES